MITFEAYVSQLVKPKAHKSKYFLTNSHYVFREMHKVVKSKR